MVKPNIINTGASHAVKLRRWDWIILPLIGVLTAVAMTGLLWLISARLFSATNPAGDCIKLDASGGQRGVPNSACWKKAAESAPVEYRFNSCGHRAGMECGPKAPNTYRIVLIGSSYSFGWAVPREKSFAAMLPVDLSRRTGRRIEVYNEGMIGEGGLPRTVVKRFNEFLTAQPDAILWIVDPWDIDKADNSTLPLGWQGLGAVGLAKKALIGKSPSEAMSTIFGAIQDMWVVSKPGVLIQHYLYLSQSEYLRLYLSRGHQSGFLKEEADPDWRYRLDKFNDYVTDLEGQAKAAGVPVMVALAPNRAQAAMISMGEWPQGYDPYKLGEEIRSIVTSHGGTYIDILPDYRTLPNPERFYYPIDNHPDAYGHAILAEMLAKELTSGAVPALGVLSQAGSASEKGK